MNLCKCGIARVDCEYHREDLRKGSYTVTGIDRVPRAVLLPGHAFRIQTSTGCKTDFAGTPTEKRALLVQSWRQQNFITDTDEAEALAFLDDAVFLREPTADVYATYTAYVEWTDHNGNRRCEKIRL